MLIMRAISIGGRCARAYDLMVNNVIQSCAPHTVISSSTFFFENRLRQTRMEHCTMFRFALAKQQQAKSAYTYISSRTCKKNTNSKQKRKYNRGFWCFIIIIVVVHFNNGKYLRMCERSKSEYTQCETNNLLSIYQLFPILLFPETFSLRFFHFFPR